MLKGDRSAGMSHGVPFREALRVWARIGLIGFGGPAGQIALMHRIVVDEKKWIGEARFLHALNYCMLLPGPEAQQLATYLGWLLHRVPGGLAAGLLFILPGTLVLFALSLLYADFGHVAWVQGLFFGLKPAVLAVVIEAVVRIGGRTLQHPLRRLVAGGAFVGLALLHLPFPAVIVAAGLLGWACTRAGHTAFLPQVPTGAAALDTLLEQEEVPDHLRPNLGRAVRVTLVCLILWAAPILLAAWLGGGESVFTRIGLFFSKMSVVTFGGAYAVLAYVAQQAVDAFHWLTPAEMLDGLGLAETTPGPLLLVVQFVGFLAAFRHPGGLPPILAGILGTLLTLWVTFVPCFLWIFLGGPYVERLRRHKALGGSLTAITAAVVGVILNLAVWFALHVLFSQTRLWQWRGWSVDLPVPASLEPMAALLAVLSMLLMLRMKLGAPAVLMASALAGLAWRLMFG